jgi:two-component system response regulator RegA
MNREMNVLIVDDDETFCRMLAETLEREGIRVKWTTDGFTGYEISLYRDFDLFILDVRMPLILGTELAEEMREDNPNARVILISAFADEELAETCKRLGVSLLSKPFSADRLLEEITKTLNRRA